MKPLEGIRVLDLSRLLPGPFATMVLADLGARVDKIEDPGAGDYLRAMPPQRGGAAAAFHVLNRGKRSAIVDLKTDAGRTALRRLVGSYDVLLEQFRPGVLARLKLAPDALIAEHPKLIVCSLTGYGQSGPYAQRAGHDLNYLARSGLLGLQGPAEGPPQVPAFQVADVGGGMWSVIAILAALRRRDATGKGEWLDVAMTDGLLPFASIAMAASLAGEPPARGRDVLSGGIAPYRTYATKDGYPVTVAALEPKFWAAFCSAFDLELDMTDLAPGPHQAARIQQIAEVFGSRSRDAWKTWAAAHDCCVEVALTPGEIADDPHLRARGMIAETEVGGESLLQFQTPVSRADPPHAASAPSPGAHTRAIFAEGGFSDEEIAALIGERAVADAS